MTVAEQGNKLYQLNKLKILLPSSISNIESCRTIELSVQTEQSLSTIAELDLKDSKL